MRLLIVFCSSEPCGTAVSAYSSLAEKRPETAMAIMDFSRVMGKDNEKDRRCMLLLRIVQRGSNLSL